MKSINDTARENLSASTVDMKEDKGSGMWGAGMGGPRGPQAITRREGDIGAD